MRFLSAWIKIRQIAHANFELRSQPPFNFCIILHSLLMTHNFLANFKLKYFQLWTKKSNQSLRFQTYKCSGENLPNFLLFFKPKVSFSSNFASLSNIMKDNSSGLLLVKHYQKGPIKVQIFGTFECSDQNSPNSCHFWNSKSVFLQIFLTNLECHQT